MSLYSSSLLYLLISLTSFPPSLAEINAEERAHTARCLPKWGRKALEVRGQKQAVANGQGQLIRAGQSQEDYWDDERGFTSQKGLKDSNFLCKALPFFQFDHFFIPLLMLLVFVIMIATFPCSLHLPLFHSIVLTIEIPHSFWPLKCLKSTETIFTHIVLSHLILSRYIFLRIPAFQFSSLSVLFLSSCPWFLSAVQYLLLNLLFFHYLTFHYPSPLHWRIPE